MPGTLSAPAAAIVRIPTTLVTGASPGAREAAIAAALDPALRTAVILEGLPDGCAALPDAGPRLAIARIAPGCPCCSGNLVMRVTLDRLLRQRPERMFIAISASAHLDRVRAFLSQEPYGKLLSLTCI